MPRKAPAARPSATRPAATTRETEMLAQIKRLRTRLEEMRDYKRLLAVDGIKPDGDDKRLESELIVRLLYLEKQVKGPDPRALAAKAKAKAIAAKAGAHAPSRRPGEREKRGRASRHA